MPAQLFTKGNYQGIDDNGNPVALGTVEITLSNSGSNAITYSDSAMTSQNTSPILLTMGGNADIYLDDGEYDVVLKNKNGQVVRNTNNLIVSNGSSSGGGNGVVYVKEEYKALDGQTKFVLSVIIENKELDVIVSGVEFKETEDYTISEIGNSVTFVNPRTLGQDITFKVFSDIGITNIPLSSATVTGGLNIAQDPVTDFLYIRNDGQDIIFPEEG